MGIHKQWYADAEKVRTPRQLKRFVSHLMYDYEHDYGTIVHAGTAAAIAGVHCVDSEPFQGGITGFQASCIMWGFITKWMHKEGPLRLIEYDNMLYPQNSDMFERVITKKTWEYLQKRANELIKENCNGAPQKAHPDVMAHWRSIAEEGKIPFGFMVKEQL